MALIRRLHICIKVFASNLDRCIAGLICLSSVVCNIKHKQLSFRLPLAVIALLGAMSAGYAAEKALVSLPSIDAGAQTRGGVASGAFLLRVTNLSDSGAGSLRAAVESEGARVVVFAAAGVISLKSDLVISKPYLTIAGQTAPSPGITLQGAKISVRTHNVIVQHIAVRPGAGNSPQVNESRDAITITSCSDCGQPTQDVRLENISASWAVDEVIGIRGIAVTRITVRNSIISEALKDAGHPKGEHSMGLLIGRHSQSIAVAGNLLASNVRRNPVIAAATSAIVVNNYIYNPGRSAVHLYTGPMIRASIIGNVVMRGPDTARRVAAIGVPGSFGRKSADALVYTHDNRWWTAGRIMSVPYEVDLDPLSHPPVHTSAWITTPADAVWPWIKRYAGKRPGDRGPIDRRIISEVENNSGRIIDRPEEAGGPLALNQQTHDLELPDHPFSYLDSTSGLHRIEAWLCEKHLEVDGPPTPECPQDIKFYQENLIQ